MVTRSIVAPESLWDRFDDLVDDHAEWSNRSEAVRELIRDELASSEPDDLPDDPRLSAAYESLCRNAAPGFDGERRIATGDAERLAAEASKVDKSVVRDNVLRPLEAAGYIQPKYGTIRVVPAEEVTG